MSYESAPATILLATRCACCGRELLDAESVEKGMGPTCRRKHGFTKADEPANWPAFASLALAGRDLDVLIAQATNGDEGAKLVLEDALRETLPTVKVDTLLKKSSREMANMIVRRAAVVQHGPEFLVCARAVATLGFTRLSECLLSRISSLIKVTHLEEAKTYRVSSPYSAHFVEEAKKIGGRPRQLAPKLWVWDFPVRVRVSLWTLLQESYPPDTIVESSKGVTVLR